jgi:hypothetical protein
MSSNFNKMAPDWEEEVYRLIQESFDDDDAVEELLDYIVTLAQEAYLRGKMSKT